MEIRRLINIYEANGLNEMQLRSHMDLLKCHGIIANDIEGYEGLTDENKAIYQEFIINFFNSYGLKARNRIEPNRVYWCKEVNYRIVDEIVNNKKIYADITKEVYAIDKFGNEELISRRKINENYDNVEVFKEEGKQYLRFEFKYDEEDGWVHVISPTEFY